MSEVGRNEPARARSAWPWVVLALGASTLLLVAWVVWILLRVPSEVVAAGGDVVAELQSLAAAFSQGTVTQRFLSHSTEISGGTRLQVATLDQVEVLVLEDAATTLWGVVDLPTVEVRATAPVSYTYYLNLDGPWELSLRDGRVLVSAPNLLWNKPAVDVSSLEYEVRQGSLLRDEEEVLETLTGEITGRMAIRARENIELVRETARRQTAHFVANWLLQHFPGDRPEVEVLFADEIGPEVELVPPVAGPRELD